MRTALGVSISPSMLGSGDGLAVLIERGDGAESRAEVDADQFAGRLRS